MVSFSFFCSFGDKTVLFRYCLVQRPLCTFATSGSDGAFNFWDKDSKQRLKVIPFLLNTSIQFLTNTYCSDIFGIITCLSNANVSCFRPCWDAAYLFLAVPSTMIDGGSTVKWRRVGVVGGVHQLWGWRERWFCVYIWANGTRNFQI